MPVDSRKKILQRVKQRKYLNKDFDAFRATLLEYARTNFPDQIRDFSEASLGGLLLDLASYVGDVTSFYLDHQFQELSVDTAVENRNIERLIRAAGVPVVGASPAVVNCQFIIEVPATGNPAVPNTTALPIILARTTVRSNSGIQFELTEDVDFRERDNAGQLTATVRIGNTDASNNPTTFILTKSGICISGQRAVENFSIGNFVPFKRFSLSNSNVTEIIRVFDNLGNEYFEVEYLTQDTIFKATPNTAADSDLVPEVLSPFPAPYRFIKQTDIDTRATTLIFGGGSAETTQDDIIPDPSEFAVPLYGKKNFPRFTLNPGNLLRTTTLGIVVPNTNISVEYRYGGGLNHNIGRREIRGVTNLYIRFPGNPTPDVSQFVRQSLDATNEQEASGGEDSPTIDQLKERVPAIKASQGRIVSREDLLARVYTMPSNFGRVFRASLQPDPRNPLAARLYVISRNKQEQLVVSPDSLKKNIQKYLNEYRLISDAIEILDARVINITVDFSIVVDPNYNSNQVLQNVINRVKEFFSIRNFDIDQPIVLAEIQNIIFNNLGVLTVNNVVVRNISGTVGTTNQRIYSDVQFDVGTNTDRGIILPPPGAIFELRFPDFDIIGTAV